jgi:hypothetical protein
VTPLFLSFCAVPPGGERKMNQRSRWFPNSSHLLEQSVWFNLLFVSILQRNRVLCSYWLMLHWKCGWCFTLLAADFCILYMDLSEKSHNKEICRRKATTVKRMILMHAAYLLKCRYMASLFCPYIFICM